MARAGPPSPIRQLLAAAPLAILAMGVERAALARARERGEDVGGFERRDTATSFGVFAGHVVAATVMAGPVGRLEGFLHRRAPWRLRGGPGTFLAALVLWDLLYYWSHRLQHEHAVLWANHSAHHSSDRFHLATALRQPWFGFLVAPMYAPLPLLGIPPAVTASAGRVDLLWQYWIHTEAVGRLPRPLEAVLNTPSHHRVHHGVEPEHLDRNYGGMLIVWDRVFGTFAPERHRPRYGLVDRAGTPAPSPADPVAAAAAPMVSLARALRAASGVRARCALLWARPG